MKRVVFGLVAILCSCAVAIIAVEVFLRVQAGAQQDIPEWQPEERVAGNPTPLDLRGPRYSFEEGQYRVLILGDSFMWGDQVDAHDDIFPVRLEQELGEQRDDSVAVVSLAQRGFTALASARALETYGAPLNPQLIVYGFYLNDAFRNYPDGTYLIWDNLWGTLLPEPAHSAWKARSRLYERLDAAYLSYKVRTDPRGWNRLYEDGAEEWDQFDEALRRMAEVGRRQNAPVLVVLWPDFAVQDFSEGAYQYEAIHRKVRTRAGRYGLATFDLVTAFDVQNAKPQSWCAKPANCHPNAEAHQIAASAVAKYLGARSLEPPTSS